LAGWSIDSKGLLLDIEVGKRPTILEQVELLACEDQPLYISVVYIASGQSE
jgi:hypothetical protein